ncbi:magnesium transporter [Bacillus coahuilensis]|uniref:magnesium transporter n=1 Tax=Bacillus coahuilensis TaxID=408580 RepID=UPI0009E823E1
MINPDESWEGNTVSNENERHHLDDELLYIALTSGDVELFRREFLELHSYDQAQYYLQLDQGVRETVYHYLSPNEMADIYVHIDVNQIVNDSLMQEMSPRYASEMLQNMFADDAVDVLNELDKNQVASYLTLMNAEAAKEIKELLHYEEYTAGSIMTTEFVAISKNQTIRSAMYILKNEAPNAETIYYIYVVDELKHLVGVLSLRDLIVAHDDLMVHEVMSDRVKSVMVGEDQEEVARMMKDYGFLALPVVDFQEHLLGIITVDDIMEVMDEEATDDYSKLAGVSDLDVVDVSPFSAAKKRLPWLIILLVLGMVTASIIAQFEETLDKVALLAVFIPLIAGMAGNTGTQALAVAVRGIATGEIQNKSKRTLLLREAGTGLITGITCGILITIGIILWQGTLVLGILVGFSIFASIFVATLAGSFVPLIMHKVNIDPAVASGPFITTINDLLSIFIYFGLATLFMNYLL